MLSVGRLNLKDVLIKLSNEEDLSRIWLRSEWTFDSFHTRVFKWTPCFDPQIESPIARVWIRLLDLPVQLFEKNALFTLAAKIGKHLRMDDPNTDQSRANLARVCVELDLTSPKVRAVYPNIEGKTFRQQVYYENCPPYFLYPSGQSSIQYEEARDLGELINNKRNGKNVSIANDSPRAPVVTIVDNNDLVHTKNISNSTSHDTGLNANVVMSLMYVHEPELLATPATNLPDITAVTSPDELNLEDPLIAELLDKDWDAEKTTMNKIHPAILADVEASNKSSALAETSTLKAPI
ncbi:UNVERIFIED_CONTAM: hypothetical protein Scaly_2621800 [Sesamum calycinum]|uniref:DUF4283 domain-containing protein n=1 Tax=Sesamum calycinum TaxID=2727403 RepID=A0AAW2JAY4_9LAMI